MLALICSTATNQSSHELVTPVRIRAAMTWSPDQKYPSLDLVDCRKLEQPWFGHPNQNQSSHDLVTFFQNKLALIWLIWRELEQPWFGHPDQNQSSHDLETDQKQATLIWCEGNRVNWNRQSRGLLIAVIRIALYDLNRVIANRWVGILNLYIFFYFSRTWTDSRESKSQVPWFQSQLVIWITWFLWFAICLHSSFMICDLWFGIAPL